MPARGSHNSTQCNTRSELSPGLYHLRYTSRRRRTRAYCVHLIIHELKWRIVHGETEPADTSKTKTRAFQEGKTQGQRRTTRTEERDEGSGWRRLGSARGRSGSLRDCPGPPTNSRVAVAETRHVHGTGTTSDTGDRTIVSVRRQAPPRDRLRQRLGAMSTAICRHLPCRKRRMLRTARVRCPSTIASQISPGSSCPTAWKRVHRPRGMNTCEINEM